MELLVALSVGSDVYSHVQADAGCAGVYVDPASLAIGPLDRQVLSKALALSPHVRAAGVCDEPSERALRYAAAMGVGDVFRVNACPSDAYSAAAHMGDFLKAHPADVVLCGQAAWDYATGDFPRWLSQITGIGLLEDVADIRFSAEIPGALEVVCQTDVRRFCVRVQTPVILSCTKAVYPQERVRIPSMRDMMLAMRSRVNVFPPQAEYPAQKVFSCFRPVPSRPPVRFLAADDYGALADISEDAFRKKEFVGEENPAAIFSGRILADVTAYRTPCARIACSELLWEETIPSHRDLKRARIVFSGGMGVDEQAWPLLEKIAQCCQAAVACTRPVYQCGRRPYYEHVGQTGAKIAPALYVALGISGALQHVAGMIRSARVLAVNTDPQAEIFKYSDYGVVGDVRTVLSGWVEELERRGGFRAMP